jgi:hypothetical protein
VNKQKSTRRLIVDAVNAGEVVADHTDIVVAMRVK